MENLSYRLMIEMLRDQYCDFFEENLSYAIKSLVDQNQVLATLTIQTVLKRNKQFKEFIRESLRDIEKQNTKDLCIKTKKVGMHPKG